MTNMATGRTAWLLAAFLVTAAPRAGEVELFVMAGQSNMQGWQGDAGHYPADPQGLDRKVKFYWVTPGFSQSGGTWTHLQPQGGRFPKGHFGPEVTFARLLAETGRPVAIFKYSLGSTSLADNWRAPGAGGMYDQMAAELRKAVRLLEEQGDRVSFKGFIWIQGESDATPTLAAGYHDRLKALVDDLRTNVTGAPALPVLLGMDEQHPWVKEHPEVVQAQQALAARDRRIAATSMIGLEKADVTHLTPCGLEDHGRRLYDAYMKLTSKEQSGPVSTRLKPTH